VLRTCVSPAVCKIAEVNPAAFRYMEDVVVKQLLPDGGGGFFGVDDCGFADVDERPPVRAGVARQPVIAHTLW
jgi:hypothetical protein